MTMKLIKNTFVVFGLALGGCVLAADKQPSPRAAEPIPKTAGQQVLPKEENAEKALAQATQNAGIQTCKTLSDQVNRYLISGSPSSGMAFIAPERANTRIFSSSMEIQNKQDLTYTSANFSPYGDTGCGISYDAVTYWSDSCPDVWAKQLKNLRSLGPLGNKISMLDGGPTMRIFLMPAGSGCVQIKKEIIY